MERKTIEIKTKLASLQQTIVPPGTAIAPEDERAMRKAADDIAFALQVAYWSGSAGKRYDHAQDAREIIQELAREGIGFRAIPIRTVVLEEEGEGSIQAAAAAPVPPGEGEQARLQLLRAKLKVERFCLEAGRLVELPAGLSTIEEHIGRGDGKDNAGAVRDLVSAKRLIDRAAAVLGDEAADEILNAMNGIGDAYSATESEAA